MRKRLTVFLGCVCLACSLMGCANDEVKVIEKKPVAEQDSGEAGSDKSDNQEKEETLKGYVFELDGISMTTDIDAAKIVEKLGEPVKYFEAASCAFQGLDKMYTYSHIEIDTYPEGDTDKILSIIFLDDMVSTKEGVYIGMTQADMEKAYGTDYEKKNDMYIYSKDGMKLTFLMKDAAISSISYDSAVLEQ